MKKRIVPLLLTLSIAVWVIWLIVPHRNWIDKDDLVYLEVVRGDLNRLVAAQDSLFARQGHYARSLDLLGIQPAPNVTIEITAVSDSGFAAKGSHAYTSGECGVFVGSAPAPLVRMTEGEVVCQ